MKSRFAIAFTLLLVVLIPGFAQDQPFSFIMLADTQLGIYAQNREFTREAANFEFAVAAINRLKPGFVIVLGDLINKEGDPGQLKEFLRISGKIDPSIPLYYLPGNHDVGATPTSETIADYRKSVGRDYYSFRAGPVYGIVLNSALFIAPQKAEAEYREQNSWLKKELEAARASGAPHVIVFMHHPMFIDNINEPDGMWTIPAARRHPLLETLHGGGVRHVFAGHVHRNITVRDGELEMTTSGAVSMPFAADGSGIRLAIITAKGLQHKYFEFGKMPDRLEIR